MQNQTQALPSQKQSGPLAIGLTILSALGRLVPHAPNVTPVGGSCLFAGSKISGFWAYLLPLVVMIATDPIVGHTGGAVSGYTWGSPVIYACFLINVWIGRRMLRSVTPIRVGGAAFLCSAQFFVVTNFALWATARGEARPVLLSRFRRPGDCYPLAIPFWGRTAGGGSGVFRARCSGCMS